MWVLAGLAVVAYLAAINRAQAFMWAIAALLSATLVTGVAWPRWLVRRLAVSRSGPSRAQEGETIQFQVQVENRGWLPRFMVELVDRLPFAAPAAPAGGQVLGVVAYLPGHSRHSFPVPVLCEKRGHYALGPAGLATSFPLGLQEARLSQDGSRHALTIYPRLFNIVALPLRGAPSQIHRGGYLLPEGAGAAEFSGLREYRRGDNPRHIHWPTTARLNELMVREYEPLASACLSIVLDQAAESDLGLGRESTFEYAVRVAASMARLACTERLRTRVIGRGRHPLGGLPGSGDPHFQGLLDELAVIASDGDTPYARVLEDFAPTCLRGETVVVFVSEDSTRWEQTLRALGSLRARQVHLLAIVFDQGSFLPQGAPRPPSLPDPGLQLALLRDLGASCVPVRQGDDLVRSFNP